MNESEEPHQGPQECAERVVPKTPAQCEYAAGGDATGNMPDPVTVLEARNVDMCYYNGMVVYDNIPMLGKRKTSSIECTMERCGQ